MSEQSTINTTETSNLDTDWESLGAYTPLQKEAILNFQQRLVSFMKAGGTQDSALNIATFFQALFDHDVTPDMIQGNTDFVLSVYHVCVNGNFDVKLSPNNIERIAKMIVLYSELEVQK